MQADEWLRKAVVRCVTSMGDGIVLSVKGQEAPPKEEIEAALKEAFGVPDNVFCFIFCDCPLYGPCTLPPHDDDLHKTDHGCTFRYAEPR